MKRDRTVPRGEHRLEQLDYRAVPHADGALPDLDVVQAAAHEKVDELRDGPVEPEVERRADRLRPRCLAGHAAPGVTTHRGRLPTTSRDRGGLLPLCRTAVVVDPVRALVSAAGAFTVTLVPALVVVPGLVGASPVVGSLVLTALVAPVLYVLFGRAAPDAD